ncbi:MAG: sigma-70 family RNA polymerase sigma factor [Bacteroidetes bacterium]|nr:sigma-70 family RNA polymerase sigma factor [Bacteroidota bacterium]
MKNPETIQTKDIHSVYQSEIVVHSDSLYSFAYQITGNSDDAHDLVQETLLKAFRFFNSFEIGTNAKAWLFQILKNTFINQYRKSSKEPSKVDYNDVQNFYETIKADEVKSKHVIGDAFSSVLDDELLEALNNLPDDFRTIIILADIEGYSYEEIAEFIDRPIGTVRSRLHRARKILYSKLYDYAHDHGLTSSGMAPNIMPSHYEMSKN